MQDSGTVVEVIAPADEALSATPSRSALPSIHITSFDRFMTAMLLLSVFTELVLCRFAGLTLPSLWTMLPGTECKILLGLTILCLVYPIPRLVDSLPLLLWSILWINPLQVLVELAARSPFPLVDRQLAAMDHALHISTAAIHAPFAGPPYLTFSILVYALFFPLLVAPVILPCLYGLPGEARRFVLGSVLGIAIGALLFIFFPAIGPWASEPMRPGSLQLTMGNYLLHLKTGQPMRMELDHSAIISFPSEHVVVALLAARALAAIRPLRRWAWVTGILVCISTITTGWHYGIDVLGGIAVAILAAWLADRICAKLEKPEAMEAPHPSAVMP